MTESFKIIESTPDYIRVEVTVNGAVRTVDTLPNNTENDFLKDVESIMTDMKRSEDTKYISDSIGEEKTITKTPITEMIEDPKDSEKEIEVEAGHTYTMEDKV